MWCGVSFIPAPNPLFNLTMSLYSVVFNCGWRIEFEQCLSLKRCRTEEEAEAYRKRLESGHSKFESLTVNVIRDIQKSKRGSREH